MKMTFCKQAGVDTESKVEIVQYAMEQNNNKQCSTKKNLWINFSFRICTFSFRNECKCFCRKNCLGLHWRSQGGIRGISLPPFEKAQFHKNYQKINKTSKKNYLKNALLKCNSTLSCK